LWGSGQIHVGLAGTDDLSPSGATLPSKRVSVAPPRIGGNPRTSSGSNVFVVAFLLECVNWYAALRISKSVVGIFQRDIHLRFLTIWALLTLVSLFILFCFVWSCLC
jgi:hypothetical protein